MKKYWYFHCSECRRKIGKRIEQAEIGRVAILNCSNCGAENRVIIGVPSSPIVQDANIPEEFFHDSGEIPEEIRHEMLALKELIEDNEVIKAVVKSIASKGFDTLIGLAVFGDKSQTSHHSFSPKVSLNGEIASDAFTKEDKRMMRQLNIKL